eukprot:5268115-Amphidinium_carterae.1
MATTTVGVATVTNSGKRDAGHLETFATGMDFEDKFSTTNRQNANSIWLGSAKQCADPRLGDFPSFEPICKDDRLSVRHIGQDVHIGFKDPRTRALSSTELIAICKVMLSLVDPMNYPTSSKVLKRTSDRARVCRDKWYATSVNEVTNQTRYTQALSSDDDAGDLHL